MTNDEIYRQCLTDLSRVNIIFKEILEAKELTEEEEERVRYCTSIVKNITEKQLQINKNQG